MTIAYFFGGGGGGGGGLTEDGGFGDTLLIASDLVGGGVGSLAMIYLLGCLLACA